MDGKVSQLRRQRPPRWSTWGATTTSNNTRASSSCSATVTLLPDKRRTTPTWACTGRGEKTKATRRIPETKDTFPDRRMAAHFDDWSSILLAPTGCDIALL